MSDQEKRPGPLAARKRLVGQRWLWSAAGFAGLRIPLNMIGFEDLTLPLLWASVVCACYGSLAMGWARGFEAAEKAKNVTER